MTTILIPVKDSSFQNLPEIKRLCPCAIHVYECQIAGEGIDNRSIELGRKFKVARVVSFRVFAKHIIYGIYPKNDSFAEQTLRKLLE